MEASWRRNYLRYKSFFLNMLTQYKERSDWKAYLEILLSLITISIFSIFALRPTLLTIAELIRQIEEKKGTVAQMDSKISSLSQAQSLYDRERNNINLLTDEAVPQKAGLDVFARQIEGVATGNQVYITRFSMSEAQILGKEKAQTNSKSGNNSKEQEDTLGNTLSYSINASLNVSQYPNVISFIREFENLRTISKIRNVDLSIKIDNITKEESLILLLEGDLPYLTNENSK